VVAVTEETIGEEEANLSQDMVFKPLQLMCALKLAVKK
jgi:hypothetical protein